MASNFKLPIVEPAPVAKPVKVLGKRVVVSVNEHIGGPGPAREHPGPVKADGLRQIKSTTQEKDSTDTPPTEKRTTEMEANTERMVKGRRTKRPEAERSKGNRQKAKGKTPSPGVKEQLLERKERKQQTQQLKHQEQKPRASQRIARQPTTTRRLPSTKGRTILADSPTSSAAKSENMTEAGDQHHLHQTDNAERNHDGNSDAPRVPLSSEHSYNNTPMAITSLQAYNNTPTAIASLQALLNEKNGIIESLLNRVHHLEEQVSQLKEKLSHYDGQDQANDSVLLLGTECHRNVNVSGGGEDASGKLRFLATDGLEDVKPVLPSSVAEGLGHSSTHDDTLAAETGLVDHIIANSVLPKTESHVVNVKPELVETESDSHHRLEDDILGGVVTMATDDVLMESIQEDERTGICSDDQSDPSTRANPCIEEEEAEIKYEEDPTFTTVDGLRVIQITPGEYSSADDTENEIDGPALLQLTEGMSERLIPLMQRQLILHELDELRKLNPSCSKRCPSPQPPTHAVRPVAGWPARYILPAFPPLIQAALDRKDVSIKGSERNLLRNGLIQILCNDITRFTWYPTAQHYREVLSTLVSKYPFLKDTDSTRTSGPKYETLLHSLRNKMKKERRHEKNPLSSHGEIQAAKARFGSIGSGRKRMAEEELAQPVQLKKRTLLKDENDDGEDDHSIKLHIKQMQTECLKVRPDWSIVQDRAKRTAGQRQHDMETLPTDAVLELYPWLAAPVMVLHEMKRKFGVELYQRLEMNLPLLVPGILKLIPQEPWLVAALNSQIEETAKKEEELNAALFLLPKLFKEQTSLMIVCNKEPGQATPTLRMSQSPEANVLTAEAFAVVLDGVTVVKSNGNTDLITGVMCLFATYFLHGIAYPKRLHNTLIFLEQYIFLMPGKTKVPTIVKRVVNSIKAM